MKNLLMLVSASLLTLFVNAGSLSDWSNHRLGEPWKPIYKSVSSKSGDLEFHVVTRRMTQKKGIFTTADFYYSKRDGLLRKIDFYGDTDKGLDVLVDYVKSELGVSLVKAYPSDYYILHDYTNGLVYRLYVSAGKPRSIHFVVTLAR